jgi:hypothetical protein
MNFTHIMLAVTINIFLMVYFHKHDWVRRYNRYIHCAYVTFFSLS